MRAQTATPRSSIPWALALLGCALVLSDTASATGFFVNQQSVKGRGRVDAGNSAAADELGTVFFNPAALPQLWADDRTGDVRASFGIELIIPRSTQDNAGSTIASPGTLGNPAPYAGGRTKNPTDPTPIPNAYVAKSLAGGKAALGFGMNAPFGLDTKSPDDWFGRYDAIEAALQTINFTFVGAYQVTPALSLGGGLDLQYAHTKLVTAVPNPLTPGGPTAATDARSETSGHAWTPGFNVGALYAPSPNVRFGVHYRSGMKHEIRGSTTVSDLAGPLAGFNGTVGARADVRLPAVATAGFWARVSRDIVVLGELEWYDWSTFNEIRTRFDDGRPDAVRLTRYRDTYGISLGVEHRRGDSPLTVRGGLKYDRTPTVDGFRDTTVPDANRLWLGLGLSYHLSDRANLDLALNHVFFRDTKVSIQRTFFDGTPLLVVNDIRGDVRTVVNTVAVDFRWSF